ncbi:hypothetical protein SSS_02152 [Sarcoptes scabiei]|nr:hypothetical protein SSS_02152 [Sarcoptes scabiei]
MIRANIIGLIVNDFNLKLFNFCSRFSLLLLLLMVIASVAIESWHFNEADISDDVDVGGFLDDTQNHCSILIFFQHQRISTMGRLEYSMQNKRREQISTRALQHWQ